MVRCERDQLWSMRWRVVQFILAAYAGDTLAYAGDTLAYAGDSLAYSRYSLAYAGANDSLATTSNSSSCRQLQLAEGLWCEPLVQ